MLASLLDALSCNTTCIRHVISTKAHPSCTTKQHEKATPVKQLLTPVSCPDRTTLATGFDLDLNDLTTSSSSTSSWPDQVIPALQPLDAYGTKFDTGDYLEDTQATYYVTTNLPLSAPKGQTGPSPSLSIAQCDGFKGNQGDGMRSADPSGHLHTGPMGPVNAQTTTTTTTRSSQDITENNNTKASTWPTTTNQVYEGELQLQAEDGYEPANNGHQPIAYEGTNEHKGPLGRVEQDDSMILAVQRVNNPVADGLLHLIFNHAPSSRIKKTLEMTEGLQCEFLPPDPHCKACAMARSTRHIFRDHTSGKHNPGTAAHHFSIGTDDLLDEVELDEHQYEDYDSDEDESDHQDGTPPAMYAEEDDFSAYDESDSDEDTYTLTSDSSDDYGESDPDEGLELQVSTFPVWSEDNPAEGGDDLAVMPTDDWIEVEYQAERIGRDVTKPVPRYDIEILRPMEIMFGDHKDYDCVQRGGYTTAFVVIDLKTLSKFKIDLVRKASTGVAAQQIMVQNGVHKLPYKCCLWTDGCGSMALARTAVMKMGIDHNNLPPHDASLNLAEYAQKQMWEIARTLLGHSNASPRLMAHAVAYAMYVDMRMSTGSARNFITPYEALYGSRPNVKNLVPFYTRTFVATPKPKQTMLRNRGIGSLRAEPGRFLGFTNHHSGTSRVMLDGIVAELGSIRGNRIVDSISVKYDVSDYTEREGKSKSEVQGRWSWPQGKALTSSSNRQPGQTDDHRINVHANQGYLPEEGGAEYTHSPGGGTDDDRPRYNGRRYACESDCGFDSNDIEEVLMHERTCPHIVRPRYNGNRYACERDCGFDSNDIDEVEAHEAHCQFNRTPEPVLPQEITPEEAAGMQDISVDLEADGFDTPTGDDARSVFYMGIASAQIQSGSKASEVATMVENAVFHAVETLRGSRNIKHVDHAAIENAAFFIGEGAQKDIKWAEALNSSLRDDAITAYEKEMTSLTETILKRVDKSHPSWERIRKEAVSCRVLLDIKRNGIVKARAVKQGFKEDKASADGQGFNYYSHVAKLASVRTLILRPDRGNRAIGVKDVSTAFLQSHRYEGFTKFVTVKNPVTNEWEYYEQYGPIYGEASAPVRWENTLIPWLEEQGFKRGQNEKSVLYHETRDIVLLVYVDDVLADASRDNIDWIFDLMDKRFKCKDADFLTEETPLDYVGIEIEKTKSHIIMHMKKYILGAIKILQSKSPSAWREASKFKPSMPIMDPITREGPELNPADTSYFLTGLGMAGWLANTVRCDLAYSHSRIGQHAARPTQEAKLAITKLFKYLEANDSWGLSVKLHDTYSLENLYLVKKPKNRWRFYTDADFAGNDEVQNQRRSQNGCVITCGDTPVHWSSKVSSVAFAHAQMGEAHSDMSSSASEVYAAGNAAQDCLHFSYCIEEMGMEAIALPIDLEMDNAACEVFCNDTAFKTRLKHIDCRQWWVKHLRDRKILTPKHVSSAENLADFFTKILAVQTFMSLRGILMTLLSDLI